MFEGLLTDALNRILGNYIKNLNAEQLQIGVWAGRYFDIFFDLFKAF